MEIYIALLSFYFIFSLVGKNTNDVKHKNCYLFLLLLPAFFLVAFRSTTVGSDTEPYSYLYEQMKTKSIIQAASESWMEVGFLFLEFVFTKIGFTYYAFQVVIAIFYFFSFFVFIKSNSSNYAFSCFLLLAMQFLFGMMNQTRMWIALSISLFSIAFIKKRQVFRFIILVFVASLIHKSALVLLPLYFVFYFLSDKKISKLNLSIFLLSISSFIIVFWKPLSVVFSSFLVEYSDYFSASIGKSSLATALLLIEYSAVFAFVSFKITNDNHLLSFGTRGVTTKAIKKSIFFKEDIFSFVVVLFVLALSLMGFVTSFISRLLSFFSIFMIYIIPNYVNRIKETDTRNIAKLVFLLVFTIHFFVILNFRPEWDSVVPYEFFF